MDIFKLFFNHDQRLDKLAKRNTNKAPAEEKATLADFMKPDPTYSKFYITGTRLKEKEFGINTLAHYPDVMQTLNKVFQAFNIYTSAHSYGSLSDAISNTSLGQAIIITQEDQPDIDAHALRVDEGSSNVGHFKEELADVLKLGHKVLYKEPAHDGFDLHLFSEENIYPQLFSPLQQLVDPSFRFFSINSKRMRSERHFYFETWTLDRPPHGAEEVFAETVL